MEKKLSKRIWLNICVFSFMGGLAWNIENMYFNTFLYDSIYGGASANALANVMAPTTAISRMVALSAITAVVTTFIMGTLSEKMKKRKVFISVGYIIWGIITAAFGFISKESVATVLGLSDEAKILATTVWVVIIMDMIMTFMGSTSNDSAFNAWLNDVTNPLVRPKVETALIFVGLFSMLAVMGLGSVAQSGAMSYSTFFLILGAIVTLSGVVGLFSLEDPKIKGEKTNTSYWSDLFYGFRPSVVKENANLYLVLAALGIYNIAIQVFFPYLFVYLGNVIVPNAVFDAKNNARRNGTQNIKFYCADAGKFMTNMAADGKTADVVFMDPPRAGSTEEFLTAVKTLSPKKLVYVSCNPATLARDVALLKERGYTLKNAMAADLFPRCAHVESIVTMIKE